MSSIQPSFVIASCHPKQLAEFYGKVNDVEIQKGISSSHFLVPLNNGLNIQIYQPSKSRKMPGKGRSVALCFQKQPSPNPLQIVCEWSLQLKEIGANAIGVPTNESFGAEAWVADPERNQFLIFVPLLN